ncbi:hypothetical protein OMO38_04515 [Chryseobacterium sp. 09-1422]|uniref:Uncharacterized protein n=1 Tax=Chryseobacterium kimseyorum TaxID=2984028 RepID=A0ABT3HVH4_9FLAO|nr:hypothetical protein [Chryseobacterium kimseyorum]MCW3167786.1 hypothetical protein [Chryseobacterium kimseyorum]
MTDINKNNIVTVVIIDEYQDSKFSNCLYDSQYIKETESRRVTPSVSLGIIIFLWEVIRITK